MENKNKEKFYALVEAGKSGATPFNNLVLEWIHFCTGLIGQGLKTSDATFGYSVFGGHATWNDNEQIIISLGKSFALNCEKSDVKDFGHLMQGLEDLQYFFKLYERFKEEGVRLYKLTKKPMSDFFKYASYYKGRTRNFLLNISTEQFAWLKARSDPEEFKFFNQESLLKNFREEMFDQHKTVDGLIKFVSGYNEKVPAKETMYQWILEKHHIYTDSLLGYWKETRSKTLANALFGRPDNELPDDILLIKQNVIPTTT